MNAALIPVRGGSKSIPLKNIKTICGKPLVYWTVRAACGCESIDRIYVATDSEIIKQTIELFASEIENGCKIEVTGRSTEVSTDTASTESVMLEFAKNHEFDNIVLIQATSPLLQPSDLERGFEAFQTEGTDSVLSVVRQKRFNWAENSDGYANPVNYDPFHRPRRQEFNGYLVENGAFYITSKERLIKYGNRISGSIKAVEMSEDTYFEIDEPSDWAIIEALMKKNGIAVPSGISDIKLFLTDCDGCMTDGGMYYSEKGDELKKFNTRDGMGFKILKEMGIITGIITGENVELNRRRAKKLKLDILEMNCRDKLKAIKAICEEKGFELKNVCYIGDDINDMETIKAVGFGCCPADAVAQVKASADFVTTAVGGRGVIREVADFLSNSML